VTIWVVSLLTAAPPVELQDFVTSIRYPKTGGASSETVSIAAPAPARR